LLQTIVTNGIFPEPVRARAVDAARWVASWANVPINREALQLLQTIVANSALSELLRVRAVAAVDEVARRGTAQQEAWRLLQNIVTDGTLPEPARVRAVDAVGMVAIWPIAPSNKEALQLLHRFFLDAALPLEVRAKTLDGLSKVIAATHLPTGIRIAAVGQLIELFASPTTPPYLQERAWRLFQQADVSQLVHRTTTDDVG
jgi:uncharacterized protein (UPF0147 family)